MNQKWPNHFEKEVWRMYTIWYQDYYKSRQHRTGVKIDREINGSVDFPTTTSAFTWSIDFQPNCKNNSVDKVQVFQQMVQEQLYT